jgi:hypothetical protein
MTGKTEKKAEIRMIWTAPKLRKVDIEQITSGNGGTNSDGFGGKHAKVTGTSDGSGKAYS